MPSKDEIYKQWQDAEDCDHKSRFWCEYCVNRSWISGLEAGLENGMDAAIQYLAELAGRMYVDHKTDQAEIYRDAADELKKIKKQKIESHRKTYTNET